jgi:hypothetical protein
MTVDPDFTPGIAHIVRCEWSRKPKPRVIPEYVRWVHTINELIAAETGKRSLHIFMLSGDRLALWVYEPNKPPQRMDLPSAAGKAMRVTIDTREPWPHPWAELRPARLGN